MSDPVVVRVQLVRQTWVGDRLEVDGFETVDTLEVPLEVARDANAATVAHWIAVDGRLVAALRAAAAKGGEETW